MRMYRVLFILALLVSAECLCMAAADTETELEANSPCNEGESNCPARPPAASVDVGEPGSLGTHKDEREEHKVQEDSPILQTKEKNLKQTEKVAAVEKEAEELPEEAAMGEKGGKDVNRENSQAQLASSHSASSSGNPSLTTISPAPPSTDLNPPSKPVSKQNPGKGDEKEVSNVEGGESTHSEAPTSATSPNKEEGQREETQNNATLTSSTSTSSSDPGTQENNTSQDQTPTTEDSQSNNNTSETNNSENKNSDTANTPNNDESTATTTTTTTLPPELTNNKKGDADSSSSIS
ncbi:uncharacterized protein TM35_000511410, partial [Trypanosoma theileri]